MDKCLILELPKDILHLFLDYLYGKNAMYFMSTCTLLYTLYDPYKRIQHVCGERNYITKRRIPICLVKDGKVKCHACKLDIYEQRYYRHINQCGNYEYYNDGLIWENPNRIYNRNVICCICKFKGNIHTWFPHLGRFIELPTISTSCCGRGITNATQGCFSCMEFTCKTRQKCPLCKVLFCGIKHLCEVSLLGKLWKNYYGAGEMVECAKCYILVLHRHNECVIVLKPNVNFKSVRDLIREHEFDTFRFNFFKIITIQTPSIPLNNLYVHINKDV